MLYDVTMRKHVKWSWAWGIWAAATGVSFGILEGMALRRKLHPTLSTTMRRWLGVHPRTSWGRVGLGAFAAAWAWLTIHLAIVPSEHAQTAWDRITLAIVMAHPIAAVRFIRGKRKDACG